MSELKAYNATIHPKMKNACDGAREVYLKSEADKVIAELGRRLNEAHTELELWRDGSIISEEHQKELDGTRHQKYKRCLLRSVIAEMNATHFEDLFYGTFYGAGSEALADEYNHQITIHYKWHKRWLELAEKFKEAK